MSIGCFGYKNRFSVKNRFFFRFSVGYSVFLNFTAVMYFKLKVNFISTFILEITNFIQLISIEGQYCEWNHVSRKTKHPKVCLTSLSDFCRRYFHSHWIPVRNQYWYKSWVWQYLSGWKFVWWHNLNLKKTFQALVLEKIFVHFYLLFSIIQ